MTITASVDSLDQEFAHAVQHLTDWMMNDTDVVSGELPENLARQASRGKTGGNDGKGAHVQLLSY